MIKKIADLRKLIALENDKLAGLAVGYDKHKSYQSVTRLQSLSAEHERLSGLLKQQSEFQQLKEKLLASIPEEEQARPGKPAESMVVPEGVSSTKLTLGNSHQVVLLGVSRSSERHATYVSKLLQRLQLRSVITQVSPDQPCFIYSDQHFNKQWEDFILGKSSRFLVKTQASHARELVLDSSKLAIFFQNNVRQATDYFQVGPHGLKIKQHQRESFQTNSFFTPLLFGYVHGAILPMAITLCYPDTLRQYDALSSLATTELRSLLQRKVKNQGKQTFDWRFLKSSYSKWLGKYQAQVIRQIAMAEEKSVAVVTVDDAAAIAREWGSLGSEPQPLNSVMPRQSDRLGYMQYIERLALGDLLLDNYLERNFIERRVFPFEGQHTLDYQNYQFNVFQIWRFYKDTYQKSIRP